MAILSIATYLLCCNNDCLQLVYIVIITIIATTRVAANTTNATPMSNAVSTHCYATGHCGNPYLSEHCKKLMQYAIATAALTTPPNATPLLCLLNIATKISLSQHFHPVVLARKPCSGYTFCFAGHFLFSC